jgi:threonine dehydrogenase-like Zn-dependent dehydrogenase
MLSRVQHLRKAKGKSGADTEFRERETTLLSSRNAAPGDLQRVMAALAHGKIDIVPLITHRTILERLPEEFERWLLTDAGLLKGVINL